MNTANHNPQGLTSKRKCKNHKPLIFFIYFTATFILVQNYYFSTIEHIPATLHKMVTYTASAPYQYRILSVWIIKLLTAITPAKNIYFWEICLRHFFLFMSMLMLKKWLSLFVKPSLAAIGPLLLGIIFPMSFIVRYTNDFPTIFFFTTLLYLLYKQKWFFYYILFAIATFNKETTLMLVLIFFLTQFKNMRKRELIFHIVTQIIIWAEIKLFLYFLFFSNSGGHLEFQLYKNLFHLTLGRGPFMLIQIFSAFGFLWVIALWKIKQQPVFLRYSCFTLIPYIIIMLFVGMINETRIWYEYIPVILAMVLVNIEKISDQT